VKQDHRLEVNLLGGRLTRGPQRLMNVSSQIGDRDDVEATILIEVSSVYAVNARQFNQLLRRNFPEPSFRKRCTPWN